MKPKELKDKNNNELMNFLDENKKKLRLLRFDLASGKVKNIRDIRFTKKYIARLYTIINLRSKNII